MIVAKTAIAKPRLRKELFKAFSDMALFWEEAPGTLAAGTEGEGTAEGVGAISEF